MNGLKFMKIQANGNDFICVEEMDCIDLKLIQRICDRHYGIGGDGLIYIGKSKKSDCLMRIFNQDGSEATLCGNGLFCVSEYYRNKYGHYPKSIETLTDVKTFVFDDGLWTNMSNGTFERIDEGIKVDVGNDHLVLFKKKLCDDRLNEIGKHYQEVYKKGINVELCHILSKNEVEAKVYERGVGKSLSCGSGACAIFIACKCLNPTLRKLYVHYDGGTMCVKEVDGNLFLHSKARIVYKGEYYDKPRDY